MSEILRTTREGTRVSTDDLFSINTSDVDWHWTELSGLTLDGLPFDGASMRNAELRGVQGSNASFSCTNAIMAAF